MEAKRFRFSGSLLVAVALTGMTSLSRAQLELCDEAGTLTRNTDGSFYYSSDLRYGQDLGELTTWMQRLNETLEADGTLLVVVPTPLRGMVNGEVVTDKPALETLNIEFDAAEASAYYRDYMASLEPIVAVDLLDAAETLKGKTVGYHQKLDRHWTPEGARASAQAVAQVLRENPTYRTLTRSGGAAFTTALTGTEPGSNRIFETIEKKCGDLPSELLEMINLYTTKELTKGDLFTQETPVVALAGSSFSTETYNFDGFLSEALGQPILNASVSGGGLDIALQDLLLKRDKGANPKVIIWEYRMSDATITEREGDYTAFRQMIPSVYGPCSSEAALVSGSAEVSGETVNLLTSTNPDIFGENYYLHLQASDLSLVEFEIVSTYEDGSADTAPVDRSTRVSNNGEYYLELSRNISNPLKEVSLNVPAGTTATIAAQVCRAP